MSVKWGEITTSKIFVRVQWANTYKALNMVPGTHNIQQVLTITNISIFIWWFILFSLWHLGHVFSVHSWPWISFLDFRMVCLFCFFPFSLKSQENCLGHIELTISLSSIKNKNNPFLSKLMFNQCFRNSVDQQTIYSKT